MLTLNHKKKTVTRIMILAILATVLLLGFICKPDGKMTTSPGIRAITLSYKFELLKPDDSEIYILSDSLRFYFFNELTLCRIYTPYQLFSVNMDKEGNITERKLIDSSVRSSYFIYTKNNSCGLLYDSLTAAGARRLTVDSLLKKRLTTNARMFYNSNDSLVATIRRTKNILEEKYVPIVKYDDTYPDSIYLYYNRQLGNIVFSFSEELDRLKKTKLCKARFIYNPRPAGRYPIDLPRRELLFQIEEAPITDQNEVIDLFERFKKDGAGR